MMAKNIGIVNQSKVIGFHKIAGNAWHLKLEVEHLAGYEANKIPGYYLPVVISETAGSKITVQRFVIWNFDASRHYLDLAITLSSGDEITPWMLNLKTGDVIDYLKPKEILSQLEDADNYLLIGDAQSLAFYYQLNRNLPFRKQVKSFIYSETTGLFFPDIDNSFPFRYEVIYPFAGERLLDFFTANFSIEMGKTVICLYGPEYISNLFITFFRDQWQGQNNQLKLAIFNQDVIKQINP